MRVLGVDPGASCGVALIETEPLSIIHLEQLNGKGIVDTPLCRAGLKNWLVMFPADKYVCEDYIGAGYRDKWSVLTLKLIGILMGCVEDITMQVPQARKPLVGTAKEMAEAWMDKPGPHRIDALAHALTFYHRSLPS